MKLTLFHCIQIISSLGDKASRAEVLIVVLDRAYFSEKKLDPRK